MKSLFNPNFINECHSQTCVDCTHCQLELRNDCPKQKRQFDCLLLFLKQLISMPRKKLTVSFRLTEEDDDKLLKIMQDRNLFFYVPSKSAAIIRLIREYQIKPRKS